MILKTIGPYQLLKSLGKGGMGEVFLARDTLCEREIALKQIREDLLRFPTIRDRFLREARIAAHLTHPSIISVYSIHPETDQIYYTMPYVEGETLKQVLRTALVQEKKGEPLHPIGASIPALARLFLSICQAIAYTHSKGILHRDLKPENIIVGKYGEVILLDWGLADFIHHPLPESNEELPPIPSHLTQPGKIVGTITYLAPERALGEGASVLTDIYALGAILYQILTLRLPFQRRSLVTFRKHLHHEELIDPQEIAPYRDIPKPLSDIVKKCLSPNKAHRYQTMEELLFDLENYIEGKPEWFLATELDIHNKNHWKFQENVLFTKHIAITRETEIMEWVSLMISKESFSGNTALEATICIDEHGGGIGFLLGIPEARQKKGIEEGYALWIGSSSYPGCKLFRSQIEIMQLPDLFLEKGKEYLIRIEKLDNHVRFFLNGVLKLDALSHIPVTGTHVGVFYRDEDLSLRDFKILIGSQNVMVNCLSIPDAFLATKHFAEALHEYRRIGCSFHGRTEGREALFRAGLTLLEKAITKKDKKEQESLFSLALEEFSKLHAGPGAPLEYLGKSLVYKAEGEIEEEVKCLELALRKFPRHPLLPRVIEQIVFRLHEASSNHRLAAYHFALLALRHVPSIFDNPDHKRLLTSLQKYWEPLPFLERQEDATLQLAFWLAKPQLLIEMIQNTQEISLIADGLFSLLELGEKELVREHLPLLAHNPEYHQALERALQPPEEGLQELPSSLSFATLRTLRFLCEAALDADQPQRLLPLFEKLDAYPLTESQRFPFDLLHLWALLLLKDKSKASALLKKYPLELMQEENTPLFSLFGCYLWLAEGKEIALTHLQGAHEVAYPPTATLLSHYLSGRINLHTGWIEQAFFWEKRALQRLLHLFHRCSMAPPS